MAKYPVSGAIQYALGDASSGGDAASIGAIPLIDATTYYVTGKLLSDRNRVLWLRSFWAKASASKVIIALQDASYGATSRPTSQRFQLTCGSISATTAATETNFNWYQTNQIKIDFPPPGIKFATQCTVICTDGTTAAIGSVGGAGYEEG